MTKLHKNHVARSPYEPQAAPAKKKKGKTGTAVVPEKEAPKKKSA